MNASSLLFRNKLNISVLNNNSHRRCIMLILGLNKIAIELVSCKRNERL